MKRVIVLTIIGLFLLLITKYFVDNFSPFNLTLIQHLVEANGIKPGDWSELNKSISLLILNNQIIPYLSNNAYIAFLLALLGIFFIFNAVHLTIDKLFFKNYFEQPSLFDSIRHSIEFILSIFLIFYLKFSGYDLQVIILINVVIVVLELLFSTYLKQNIINYVLRLKSFKDKINSSVA